MFRADYGIYPAAPSMRCRRRKSPVWSGGWALAGRTSGRESVGVGPHDHAAVGPVDAVFVELPLAQPGDKAAPHAGVGFLERDACAPAVKAAADLHSRGTGSPDCEAPALFAVVTLPGVRAEDAVASKQSPLKKDLGMEGRFIRKTPFIAIFTENAYDGRCKMRNIQHFYHTFVGKCAILNRTQMHFCRKSALL